MGAGTSAEEFFLKSINVESIFEFVERTDYLFLYSIKECVEKSDCHEGVYLSEVAEYMKLSIPETSKMVKSLENKGYIIWKLDEKKERTYLVLTNKAIELSNCQKEKMIEAYEKIISNIQEDDLAVTRCTLRDVVLKPEGLILIDSGAQYQDGTTDITRTIALGPVSQEMKHVYTLVLKAHIQLELVKFPDGASGTQLDAVGRECMWREGYNFLHGTGHGVGSYLCVHEGPHQIRMEWMPTPLRAGMTLTDEPGLYLAGKFGVRIENTVLISDYMSTEFGKFLQIEPLTLCPIDTAPIDVDMLLPEEIDWLNAYHYSVYEKLSPFLDEEEKIWLENATKPIK